MPCGIGVRAKELLKVIWCNCRHSRNLEEEGEGGAAVRPVHVPESGMGGGGPYNTVNSNEDREVTQPCLE